MKRRLGAAEYEELGLLAETEVRAEGASAANTELMSGLSI